MGYNKIIKIGNQIELYTYEKDLSRLGRKTKGRRVFDVSDVLPSVVVSRASCVESLRSNSPEVGSSLQKRRDHVYRSVLSFKRLVLSNISEHEAPLLVTLTYAENCTNLRLAYRHFDSFRKSLRRRFGSQFRYIAVPEFQKRGAIHFHAFFWGLPASLSENERSTRLVASLWGQGFADVFLTDGSPKLVSYLAKYMAKSASDSRLFGKKAFRSSHNIFRPVIYKNVPLWWITENMDLSTVFLCKSKDFHTQWLGKGRYQLYNLIKKNDF